MTAILNIYFEKCTKEMTTVMKDVVEGLKDKYVLVYNYEEGIIKVLHSTSGMNRI